MIKIPATTLFKKEGGVYDQAAAISIKIPATTLFKKEGARTTGMASRGTHVEPT